MLATRAIRGRKKDASPSLCSHPRHPPPDCDATTVWTRFLKRLYARLYAREGLTGNAFAMISCVRVRRRKGFFSVLTTSEAITPPDGDAMPGTDRQLFPYDLLRAREGSKRLLIPATVA